MPEKVETKVFLSSRTSRLQPPENVHVPTPTDPPLFKNSSKEYEATKAQTGPPNSNGYIGKTPHLKVPLW